MGAVTCEQGGNFRMRQPTIVFRGRAARCAPAEAKNHCLFLRPGMVADDCLPEIFPVEMCIYFSGNNGFMSKHLLYCAQIRTSIHEVCGKGVPEGMWTDAFADAGFLNKLPDDCKDHDPGELSSAPVQEEDIHVSFIYIKHCISVRHIIVDFFQGSGADRDQSFLVPFPNDSHEAFI